MPTKTASRKSTRMARHNQRTASLFPEMATPVDKRLALRQDIIDYPAQDIGSMGHIARLLAQFGLPHSDPGADTTVYKRENGDLSFQITSHVSDGGIPWGVLPRLLLAYVSSQACLTKNPTIHLGANLSSFLRDELGMSVTGGKNGTITRIKEQAYRLFTSHISIVRKKEDTVNAVKGTRKMIGMMQIAKSIDMWEPHTNKSPDELWQSTVVLDQTFYQATVTAAVPIDWRIVNGIQNSALALDLYFWLTYRMKTIAHKTTICFFGENSIYEQLGGDYAATPSGRYAFKKKVMQQIEEIRFYWPELRVHMSEDGRDLILFPSPTSVSSLKS